MGVADSQKSYWQTRHTERQMDGRQAHRQNFAYIYIIPTYKQAHR